MAEGTTLSMMLSAGIEAAKTMAQLFAANLQQLGLTLDAQAVDETTFIGTVFGDAPVEERPHFFPLFWQPDYDDGWNHLYPQVACDAAFGKGANAGVYCNERVDALAQVGPRRRRPSSLPGGAGEIQRIVAWDDPAAVYYVQTQWTTILRRRSPASPPTRSPPASMISTGCRARPDSSDHPVPSAGNWTTPAGPAGTTSRTRPGSLVVCISCQTRSPRGVVCLFVQDVASLVAKWSLLRQETVRPGTHTSGCELRSSGHQSGVRLKRQCATLACTSQRRCASTEQVEPVVLRFTAEDAVREVEG